MVNHNPWVWSENHLSVTLRVLRLEPDLSVISVFHSSLCHREAGEREKESTRRRMGRGSEREEKRSRRKPQKISPLALNSKWQVCLLFQMETSESVLYPAQCWFDGLRGNKYPRLLSSSILLYSSAWCIHGPLADGRPWAAHPRVHQQRSSRLLAQRIVFESTLIRRDVSIARRKRTYRPSAWRSLRRDKAVAWLRASNWCHGNVSCCDGPQSWTGGAVQRFADHAGPHYQERIQK